MVLSVAILLFYLVSVVVGSIHGELSAVCTAMTEGASDAVSLSIALAGPICLWCALQEIMETTGISSRIAGLLSPVLRLIYPRSTRDPECARAISQNLSANLLGLGNAATPMGIRAVTRMRTLSGTDRATDEMCRLIVMNTASVQLIPTTVAAARGSLGAARPYCILPAVWLSSLCSVSAGLLAARFMERAEK